MLRNLLARKRDVSRRHRVRKTWPRHGDSACHRRPFFEPLEPRRLLAALVGVDFDPSNSSSPSGWTSLGALATPFTQNNLGAEDGTATPFDLTIVEVGPAAASCGSNQICHAPATPAAATIPAHSQPLDGIDGQVFSDAHPVTLTWSDLTPGDLYEVYVFGLEGHFNAVQQVVQISGGGLPISFPQHIVRGQLFVNDELGSSGRPLSSYAKLVAADNTGRIGIQVSPAPFSLDVSLGGIALREASPPGLTVSIAAASIAETGGSAATTATVSRNADTTDPLTVTLASSDSSEATVPATVEIPAGQRISPPFPVNAVDDSVSDGTQTVTISAQAAGHVDGADLVSVTDNEQAALALAVSAEAISEADGAGAATAIVSRNTPANGALIVNLASSDQTEATVPTTVIIPAGQTASAPFDVNAVDDLLDDGTQTVTITASALGHAAAVAGIDVVDDDVANLLSVSLATDAVSEAGGAGATSATVGRRAGLTINRVQRGAVAADGRSGTQTDTNQAGGDFAAQIRRQDPDNSAQLHQVSHESSLDAQGLDGEGFAVLEDQSGYFQGIGDSSFFDAYFDLASAHTFTLTGRVVADANNALASSTVSFAGPGTQFSFLQTAGPGRAGGLTEINESGRLDPGTYHFVATASGAAAGLASSADASYVFDLQLTAAELTVTLASSDTTEASVPSAVTLSAGQHAAVIAVDAVDDLLLDGTQTVTISANAAGHVPGSDRLDVTDDEAAGLRLVLADRSVSEGAGTAATTATVSRSSPVTNSLTVALASSDTSEATVPASVTIPAGQSVSAPFHIAAVDDAIIDGTQTVTITASAAPFTNATALLNVTDDDTVGFTVLETHGHTLVFEDGSTDTFHVLLDASPASDVVLQVVSGDEGEVTVDPAELRFTSANWNTPQTVTVTGVDDADVDGDQITPVTIRVNDADSDDRFDPLPDQTVPVTTRDVDGAVRGTVWNDVDGNQRRSSDEPGLPGVTVYLDLNRNGQFDPSEPARVSAADGSYAFEELPGGEYVVGQIVPAGFAQTFPPTGFAPSTYAELVNDQANLPVFATHAPRDASRLFVVEKGGAIRVLDLTTGQLRAQPFLTIADTDASASESGLLGLAFHPDYANNGKFYVNVTVDNGVAPGPFATHIREYRVSSNPDVADPASVREILRFDQPFGNHNGGWLGFGPNDDYLYIASGDGGSGGDPLNHGQSLETLLGKMLRVDVNADAFPSDANANYAIPPTNPFVSRAGARAEIWAYGLRNPWRDSFDRQTGDLWIGDVGQGAREEIDFQAAGDTGGQNYAWNRREGRLPFQGGPLLPGDVQPVYDYAHGDGELQGNSVIGGYVYRGPVDAFTGRYVFADSLSNNIWSFDPADPYDTVRRMNEGLPPDSGRFGGGPLPSDIVSFAEDHAGHVYLVQIDGEIHRMNIRLPGTHSVFVVPGNVVEDVDFGNRDPRESSLGDLVWHDLDRDGIQDDGEPGRDGVGVKLLAAGSLEVIADTSTSGGGKYRFDGMAAGEYVVQFLAPEGFEFSPPDRGDDDSRDSDPAPNTGRTGVIRLPASTSNDTIDAGLQQRAQPTLRLVIAADSISEGAGQEATTATVSRSGSFNSPLTVALASNDTSEATVRRSVVIPAGQSTSPRFAVNAVDDPLVDGTQTVTLTARALGHTAGADTVDVKDDDRPLLTVSIAADAVIESAGQAATSLTVTRNTAPTTSLVVTLTSSDTSEATVPRTVTIPAGQTSSGRIPVNAIDDALVDGTQTVTISARELNHAAGSDTLDVADDDGRELEIVDVETSATLEHKAKPGQVVAVHGTFRGARPGERLSVDFWWGDGTKSAGRVDPLTGRIAGEHRYRSGGIFEVNVLLSSTSGRAARASIETVVSGVRLTQGTLQIIGTRGQDVIRVWQQRGQLLVQTQFQGQRRSTARFPAARVESMLIVTCEGNDRVHLNRWLGQPATILAGAGHDVIRSGRGDDVIDGGPGNDFIMSGHGADRVTDRAGHNRIFSGSGDDLVITGAGRDRIVAAAGHDVIHSGDGDDWIDAGNGHDVISAGPGDDVAKGGPGDDDVSGGAGNDAVYGGPGSDVVRGDDGHDRVHGGPDGRNTLVGGRGHDLIWGGAGPDRIEAGDGRDFVLAGAGNDLIDGGGDHDVLNGGSGDDLIRGGSGNDLLLGGPGDGNDILLGEAGHDRLLGGAGRDILIGGLGRDYLASHDGADILVGGTTDHDRNDVALQAILTEWTSHLGYLSRVRNLRSGRGSLGGIRLAANHTVHDDGAADEMLGGGQRDWFFADLEGLDRDRLLDRTLLEEVDLL